MRPIILLDVDGVIADFTGKVLSLGDTVFGTSFTFQDVKTWDLFSLFSPEQAQVLTNYICAEKFCYGIEVLPGAKEAVAKLRELGDVYAVTAPWWDSKHWLYERTEWLKKHFGFSNGSIVHTGAKHLVRGDVMIDDKPENLYDWSNKVKGLSILIDAPYNQLIKSPNPGFEDKALVRAKTWDEVILYVKALKGHVL